MTNSERYKRAFSTLHTSEDFKAEAVMNRTGEKNKRRFVPVLASVLILALGSMSVAYAANIGGFRTMVKVWTGGRQVTGEMQYSTEGTMGTYSLTYSDENGTEHERGGGGIVTDLDGKEHPASAGDLMEEIDSPEVVNEDGRQMLEWHDQAVDLTGKFVKGIARIELKDGKGEKLFVTVHRDGSLSTAPDGYAE